jgi:hypothetical protein
VLKETSKCKEKEKCVTKTMVAEEMAAKGPHKEAEETTSTEATITDDRKTRIATTPIETFVL